MVNFMVLYFYKLRKNEIDWAWSQNDQFSWLIAKILVKMVEKLVNFMVLYSYELEKMESTEPSLKMTNFPN